MPPAGAWHGFGSQTPVKDMLGLGFAMIVKHRAMKGDGLSAYAPGKAVGGQDLEAGGGTFAALQHEASLHDARLSVWGFVNESMLFIGGSKSGPWLI